MLREPQPYGLPVVPGDQLVLVALPNGCQRSNIDTALFTLLYSAVYKIGKKEFLFAFFVQRALELFKLNI